MGNEKKLIGKGQYAVRQWEDIKKGGGFSYSPEQIQKILEEGSDDMLTRDEVKNRISAYFQGCIIVSQNEDTGEIEHAWKRNPTKSGLALALSVSPQTLIDYMHGVDRHGNAYKPEGENKGKQKIATADFDLVRKAYALIEDFYEQKLADNRNNSGVIFWLLNSYGGKWTNEQKIEVSTERMKESPPTPDEIAAKYSIEYNPDEIIELPPVPD